MSDIMTDMKTKTAPKKKAVKRRPSPVVRDTFTVRDLNRQPQVVLTAARKLGRVTIRSRDGGAFKIIPELAESGRAAESGAFFKRLAAMRAKLRAGGFVPPSARDSATIARVIAGEEP